MKRPRPSRQTDDANRRSVQPDGSAAVIVAKGYYRLKDENERLKEWIRQDGVRNDTCTYDVLHEICEGCRCKRQPQQNDPDQGRRASDSKKTMNSLEQSAALNRRSPASGCSTARLEQLKAELNERRLTEIAAMLDDAGVPEWVENNSHRGVPSNGCVSRLKWYLARRKNVAAHEIDQKLQREMRQAEIDAREYMGR
jgi:hypothetical protein